MFFTDIKVDIKKNWHLYISIPIHIHIYEQFNANTFLNKKSEEKKIQD